jgi:uncharacterized coiled-coil protein SlyX
VHNFIAYEKRHKRNIEKSKSRNIKKSKKIKLKFEMEQKDADLKILTDQLSEMEKKDADLKILTDQLSEMEKKDAELKTMTNQLSEMEKKEAELKILTNQLSNLVAQYKTQFDQKDAELKTMTNQLSEMEKKEAELKILTNQLSEMEKKDADLKILTDQLSEMEKKEAELNLLRDQTAKMERHKTVVANTRDMQCIICQDIFKCPVVLPCGHVVCMGCLYKDMMIKYACSELDFKKCAECRTPFELDRIVRLYGFDEISESLASVQEICHDNQEQISSFDDWKREKKYSEECYNELKEDNGSKMIRKWSDIKRGRITNTVGEVMHLNRDHDPYDTLDDHDDDEERRMSRPDYLLKEGIVASHYLEDIDATRDAINMRMDAYAVTYGDIASSNSSLTKLIRHLAGNPASHIPIYGFNPSDNKTTLSETRQKAFDSYFSRTYGNWNKLEVSRLQSMYDTKKNLRRNWMFLGLEPDVILFSEGEEEYCDKLFKKEWKKKRSRSVLAKSGSSSSSSSNHETTPMSTTQNVHRSFSAKSSSSSSSSNNHETTSMSTTQNAHLSKKRPRYEAEHSPNNILTSSRSSRQTQSVFGGGEGGGKSRSSCSGERGWVKESHREHRSKGYNYR